MGDPVSLGLMATTAIEGLSSAGAAASTAVGGMSGVMSGLSMGGSVLGSLFQAAGAKKAGEAQGQQLLYQAGIADLNRKIAEQNASYASIQGEEQAAKYGLEAAQRKGQIVAGQAASGLDVRSGSAADVQRSQDILTTMDMNQIRANAAKTAFNYQSQAETSRAQGAMYRVAAAETSPDINVMSSLIGGATSVADKWLQGRQLGLWGKSTTTKSTSPMQLPGASLFGGSNDGGGFGSFGGIY